MKNSNSGSGACAWSDEDFLRAFEDLSFPANQFRHREHLRIAWLYLKSSDASRASERMTAGIRRFANQGSFQPPLLERTLAILTCARGVGCTRLAAASRLTGLPLLLISSRPFSARRASVLPAFRPKCIARTTSRFLP